MSIILYTSLPCFAEARRQLAGEIGWLSKGRIHCCLSGAKHYWEHDFNEINNRRSVDTIFTYTIFRYRLYNLHFTKIVSSTWTTAFRCYLKWTQAEHLTQSHFGKSAFPAWKKVIQFCLPEHKRRKFCCPYVGCKLWLIEFTFHPNTFEVHKQIQCHKFSLSGMFHWALLFSGCTAHSINLPCRA